MKILQDEYTLKFEKYLCLIYVIVSSLKYYKINKNKMTIFLGIVILEMGDTHI